MVPAGVAKSQTTFQFEDSPPPHSVNGRNLHGVRPWVFSDYLPWPPLNTSGLKRRRRQAALKKTKKKQRRRSYYWLLLLDISMDANSSIRTGRSFHIKKINWTEGFSQWKTLLSCRNTVIWGHQSNLFGRLQSPSSVSKHSLWALRWTQIHQVSCEAGSEGGKHQDKGGGASDHLVPPEPSAPSGPWVHTCWYSPANLHTCSRWSHASADDGFFSSRGI